MLAAALFAFVLSRVRKNRLLRREALVVAAVVRTCGRYERRRHATARRLSARYAGWARSFAIRSRLYAAPTR
jgi:hypothetical protein